MSCSRSCQTFLENVCATKLFRTTYTYMYQHARTGLHTHTHTHTPTLILHLNYRANTTCQPTSRLALQVNTHERDTEELLNADLDKFPTATQQKMTRRARCISLLFHTSSNQPSGYLGFPPSLRSRLKVPFDSDTYFM